MDIRPNQPWTRRHDDPRRNLFASVPLTAYPQTLADLIELCRDRPPEVRLHAAGSHWALSESAISDHTFIETHDPRNVLPAMGRTLWEVVPHCLHDAVIQRMRGPDPASSTLVHIESGKRIYQLYAELGEKDPCTDGKTLGGYMKELGAGEKYQGPWAFETLGGAGGQTVVGAFSTGTHGGDFVCGALADSVVAMHLVADGGEHYWIEAVDRERYAPQLTDDDKLMARYGSDEYGGPRRFHIIRDNDVFDAVLVSAGRFGIIYSAVLRAVPQYALWERRRLHLWQDWKHKIASTAPENHDLFSDTAGNYAPGAPQRFLQIVVCLTPHLNFQRNLIGITKRWQMPLTNATPGKPERVGAILTNRPDLEQRIGGTPFEHAGAAYPYSPSANNPLAAGDASMLDRACSNGSFMHGILDEAVTEIEEFVSSNGTEIGVGVGVVAAAGGAGLLALIPGLILIALAIKAILEAFNHNDRLGEHLENLKNTLLDPNEQDPIKRAAGVFAWQLIAYKIFESMQGDLEFGALSYAVMDRKNYRDLSCEHNVASVEVFFDADDSRLVAFVDALIAFEIEQEFRGKSFLGYASLRFTGRTRAHLGMERWARTCAIEVAGLKDMSGSEEMVEYAAQLALNPNFGGILHWGQYNPSNSAQVASRFGGSLVSWRGALARITANGARDGFSNEFTRRTGLET